MNTAPQHFIESKEFYQALVRNLSWNILLIDKDCNIIFNETNDKFFGYDGEELAGKNWSDFLSKEDQEYFFTLLKLLSSKTKNKITAECRVDAKDGKQKWIEFTLNNLTEDPYVHAVLVSYHDITDHKNAQRASQALIYYDNLTGMINRSLFRDRLHHSILDSQRNLKKSAVLFIEIDGEKFNDKEEFLKEVAEKLKNCIRSNDTICRYNRNKFAVILMDLNSDEDAEFVAKKIERTLSKPINIGKDEVIVNTTIGIAIYPTHTEDPEQLILFSETAMVLGKREGENIKVFRR